MIDAPDIPLALRYFGGAGLSHMKKYGTKLETFAKIRAKASRHATNNPLALFRKDRDGRRGDDVADDLARGDDAADGLSSDVRRAAAVLVSETFATHHGLRRTVAIAAQAMTTDTPSTFEAHDMMRLVGFDMAGAGAKGL